ncbi:MAG TPA: hypothetical protein DDZ51_09510 [Planctomycetaceae bacterium]|nr:hypothetical protein [Planctomycetaceae bacterium]
MARPKRTRISHVPLTAGKTIRVADAELDFDQYRHHLARNAEHAMAQRHRIADPNKVALALICGRFIAAKSPHDDYEATMYCKAVRCCRRCYHCREHNRGESIANDAFAAKRELNLMQYIFTMPRPKSKAEEVQFTAHAHGGIGRIVRAKQCWNRQRSNIPSQWIDSFAVGLHVKYEESTRLLWPHVHLAVVTGKAVRWGNAPECGLYPCLKSAFEGSEDFPGPVVITGQVDGRLGNKVLPNAKRERQHKSRIVTPAHLANVLAYCTRHTEDDDTPEAVVERDHLLTRLGITTTFKRSRLHHQNDPTSKQQKIQGPSEFHPVRLGKPSIYYLPLDGGPEKCIDPNDYDAAVDAAKAESLALVKQH